MARWATTVELDGLTWGDLRRLVALATDYHLDDGALVEFVHNSDDERAAIEIIEES